MYVAVINFAANLRRPPDPDAAVQLHLACWRSTSPRITPNPNGSSEAFNRYDPAAAEAAGINVVFSGHDHSWAPAPWC